MIKKIVIGFLLLISQQVFSLNDPILVTESVISLNNNEAEELYFSFAKGDVIVFNIEMIQGGNLKEIEVYELPNTKIFSEYKLERLTNKKIQIKNKGLYKFRFYNSSLIKKVCRIKIDRIPFNETTQKFNTNWKWGTVGDTIYSSYKADSIVGYNVVSLNEKVKELSKTENFEEILFNKNQRVHSNYNVNNNKVFMKVELPKNSITDLKEEKIIGWAYWIGVGEEGQKAYLDNTKIISKLVKEVTSFYATPLAGFAMGAVTEMLIPKKGEDVYYTFLSDLENAEKFMKGQSYSQFDKGNGIAAYGKNNSKTSGTFYIGLANDNKISSIDVDVKVVAIKEVKTFKYVVYKRERKDPILISVDKRKMDINYVKARVPVE